MRAAEQWQPAPKNLLLPENVVHVWRAELGSVSQDLLSPDERQKAAQFHFDRNRNQYIAARAILRQLIGLYENLPPAGIQFTYNSFGKPARSRCSRLLATKTSAWTSSASALTSPRAKSPGSSSRPTKSRRCGRSRRNHKPQRSSHAGRAKKHLSKGTDRGYRYRCTIS
jgi:hypothetical protein